MNFKLLPAFLVLLTLACVGAGSPNLEPELRPATQAPATPQPSPTTSLPDLPPPSPSPGNSPLPTREVFPDASESTTPPITGPPPEENTGEPPLTPPTIFPIPGRIEAEDYKLGGEGVGYHDIDAGNAGGEYRSDDVDIQSTSDDGGGFKLISTSGSEWLAFDIEVSQGGNYDFTARVASGSDRTKSFHVEVDGQDVTGTMSFDDSQGYDTFVDVTAAGISLAPGVHELRFVMHTGYFSFNYLEVSPSPNQTPLVEAGPDQTIILPENAALEGSVSDDGLPNPPGTVTTAWTKVSGPGSVGFGDPAAVVTSATFSEAGVYILQLSAEDGSLSATDDVTVTVNAAPSPVPSTPPAEDLLEGPKGVAFYEGSSRIYVTNTVNETVQYFNTSGGFLSEWGGLGDEEGRLNEPGGIAINHDSGFVYVADTQNHRVQMFNTAGIFVTEWGGQGDGDGEFNGPTALAINPSNGFIYVADTGNHRVQVFDSSGGFITKWGQLGSDDGELSSPSGVAFNVLDGKVYVADTGNNRIQVFLSSGGYDSKWGSEGSEQGQFLNPSGILVHPLNGSVYVTDSGNHRVQVFGRVGGFWFGWGSEGSEPGKFQNPVGLAVNPEDGRVYVADLGNQRVQAFSQGGTFTSEWRP